MSQQTVQIVESTNRSELARAICLDRSYVSLVLSGKRTPSLPVAAKMARKLGVTLDDFNGYLERKAN